METDIAKLFGIQDVGFMIAIGVVAWVCKRSARVPEDLALLIPLTLGGVVGGIQAWDTATFGSGTLIKGIIVTAAGATIAARLADELLIRVGLIKKPEEKPSEPQVEDPTKVVVVEVKEAPTVEDIKEVPLKKEGE